ncbi:hypothetical protein [Burkholderia sp. A9]|uniref:hypothetical protein n=1 Tax=Burkholderia sp. A9 TaxID=1365108 RepID=UPI0006943FD9|nr:hypothetical protein [Burkholderia sp. A9]
MTLLSLAEYARRVGKSRAAVSQWKKAGRLVLQGDQVDVEATDAKLKRYRRDGLPDIDPAPKSVKRGRPPVKQSGKSVKQTSGAAQLNNEPVRLLCVDVVERLAALDWTRPFDWSPEAQDERARLAAQCIGWEAVRSAARDDGHWGGFQLRIPAYIELHGLAEDAIPAGHGFELYSSQVLDACRDELEPIDNGDKVLVRLDLLHLLAYPFSEHQRKPD